MSVCSTLGVGFALANGQCTCVRGKTCAVSIRYKGANQMTIGPQPARNSHLVTGEEGLKCKDKHKHNDNDNENENENNNYAYKYKCKDEGCCQMTIGPQLSSQLAEEMGLKGKISPKLSLHPQLLTREKMLKGKRVSWPRRR